MPAKLYKPASPYFPHTKLDYMFTLEDFLTYTNGGAVTPIQSKKHTAKRKVTTPAVILPSKNQTTTTVPNTTKSSLQPSGPVMVYSFNPTTIASANLPVDPVAANKPTLELVPYSDKAFAIFGATKPMQDQLEALGGKFNRWLKKDGKPTPGYIFSNKRLDTVKKTLAL